ncbi:Hypothetical predicted protein [Mytilus galloprovincialis]|uniref:Endonuclease/exonuclease/phosphatase domain-containing protein n=1 Tax=Mytilus galloprovincialis TaxID=29158 RepID=A0A8B6CV45_MYTGA|nr:Hypothetical predicted protein [Mytilus galloprovincialis]
MNVRGIFSSKKKRLDIFDWVRGKHASIICFQETHSNDDIEKLWQDEWGNTCIFSHCNNKSAGVSVMFTKGLDFKIHDSKIDQKGRFIVLDLSLYEQRITFFTVYGFNTDEPSLFSDILHNISCYINTSILMCIDWNVVQDFHMDTYNILHNRNLNSGNKIEEISQTFELLDPWRTCHPDDKKIYLASNLPYQAESIRLFFLVSEDLFSLMKNAKLLYLDTKPITQPLCFTFSASLDKRGKGYWKFNSQLLRDTVYVEKAPTEAVQTNLNDKKVELESMREQKIEGLLLRSRANWHENDFSQGGLNMVHLQSFCTYLKLSWVKRFLSNSDGTWQNLLLAELKQLGGDRVFTLQKDKIKEISNRLKNPFWKDIFECLHMAKPYTKLCVPEILSLDILNFIPISEYPVYMKWKLYGIQFIKGHCR